MNCRLNENTIERTEKLQFESKATLDLQTIIKSEDLNFNILKEYFNVNDSNIKEIIGKITSKVEFKNVFISFSFKDKKFAERLHKELTAKGIRSFFWMKDAPPGELLETIMSSGIKSHDKILFIYHNSTLQFHFFKCAKSLCNSLCR